MNDPSPLVRKQALAGLARARRVDDPACIRLLTEWIKGSADPIQNAFRGLAADALARAGAAAVPALLGLLADERAAASWPYAVRALGDQIGGLLRHDLESRPTQPSEQVVARPRGGQPQRLLKRRAPRRYPLRRLLDSEAGKNRTGSKGVRW